MSPIRTSPSAIDPRSDIVLLEQATSGAAEAFAALFDRHVRAIHAYLVLRVGSHAAEDLVAETFTTAWLRRDSFRADATSARPWLYGIATNVVHRHLDAERRWADSIRAGQSAAEGVPEADAPEPARELLAALATLTPSERDVLLLSALGELRDAEVAHQLGISTTAMRVRLHRARRRLQRELGRVDR